jgi:hypothetical protein
MNKILKLYIINFYLIINNSILKIFLIFIFQIILVFILGFILFEIIIYDINTLINKFINM